LSGGKTALDAAPPAPALLDALLGTEPALAVGAPEGTGAEGDTLDPTLAVSAEEPLGAAADALECALL